jgi:hypothetical protein
VKGNLAEQSRRRSRRIFRHSGSFPIPFRILQSPTTDQFYSQEDLFFDSEPTLDSDKMSTSGFPQAIPVSQPVPPTPVQLFSQVLVLNNTKELHVLIAANQAQFTAKEFIDQIQYQGFERNGFILSAARRISASQMLRLAIIGAIRGANFDKIIKSSEKVDDDLKKLVTDNVVKRKAVGSTDITILRCTAALPQWCAFFLGSAGVQKKIASLDCPASLQFPSAGSLPMSKIVRKQHIQFSMHFSKLIKGTFNENIYMTMMGNTIPLDEIPDSVRLVLGDRDTSFDVSVYIEEVKKELGTAVVKV